MSPYEDHDYDDGGEHRDLKAEEFALDAADEQRHAEQAAAADDDGCPEEVHCGNDCGGTSANDGTGERYEAEDCVHCDCCTCNSCAYARVA